MWPEVWTPRTILLALVARNEYSFLTPMSPAAKPRTASAEPVGTKRVAMEEKRETILEAALGLFVERGFYGTAVPEIAERAGVGAGTIYRYFESKEALVNELYRQTKAAFAAVALNEFPAGSPTREQFRVLWMRMSKFAVEHPNAFVFMELHHHQRYLDDESRALEARLHALFVGVIANAQARGELKAGPPDLLIGVVMGAFIGVIRSCVELALRLNEADWKLGEQMVWEAIRA